MRTIIVTPLYYISRHVRDVVEHNKGNKVTFIITDDASPIFPLEYRMDWIDYTFMDESIEIESIVQSDESEEFRDAVIAKIKYTTRDDKEKPNVMLYVSDESSDMQPLEDVESCKIVELVSIEDAIEDREDVLDVIFKARFLPQLRRFAKPKEPIIPKERGYIVIPFTEVKKKLVVGGADKEVTHRYYAYIKDYPAEKLDIINGTYVSPDVDTAMAKKHAEVTASVYLGIHVGDIKSTTFRGTYQDRDVWTVDLGADKCNPESPFGLRKYLAESADIIFIRDDMLVDALQEFGAWVSYVTKEQEDE